MFALLHRYCWSVQSGIFCFSFHMSKFKTRIHSKSCTVRNALKKQNFYKYFISIHYYEKKQFLQFWCYLWWLFDPYLLTRNKLFSLNFNVKTCRRLQLACFILITSTKNEISVMHLVSGRHGLYTCTRNVYSLNMLSTCCPIISIVFCFYVIEVKYWKHNLPFKPLDEQCILIKLPVCHNLKINFISLVYLTNDWNHLFSPPPLLPHDWFIYFFED